MTTKAKILVVDDAVELTTGLSSVLADAGYNSTAAFSGEEALSLLANKHFDLVLLDIKLPDVDGIEVLKQIKKKYDKTIVIMLTAFNNMNAVIASMRLGAAEYVTKPYLLEDLLPTIERVLDEGQDKSDIEIRRLADLVRLLEEKIKFLEEEKALLGIPRTGTSFDLSTLHDLIAALAHSLKGELTNISAAASQLKELGQNNSEIQEEGSVILRSAEFGQLLLRRMIEFTKGSKAQITALEPHNILREIKELMKPRLPSNIILDLVIEQGMAKNKFYADREGILMVLIELINNSMRVLLSTGGTIRLVFTLIGKDIRISVEDNGPGIPEEIKKSLFSNRVYSKTGLGLGLYLCSRMVKSMHGKLKFATQKGKGTSFFILLPLELESLEK